MTSEKMARFSYRSRYHPRRRRRAVQSSWLLQPPSNNDRSGPQQKPADQTRYEYHEHNNNSFAELAQMLNKRHIFHLLRQVNHHPVCDPDKTKSLPKEGTSSLALFLFRKTLVFNLGWLSDNGLLSLFFLLRRCIVSNNLPRTVLKLTECSSDRTSKFRKLVRSEQERAKITSKIIPGTPIPLISILLLVLLNAFKRTSG